MKKMQKFATLVVTAAMGLTLAACSTSSTTTTTVSTSDGETTKTTTTSSSSSTGSDSGTASDTYTNSVLKFGYTLPADLDIKFASEGEVGQMNGIEFSNDNIAKKLDAGESVVFAYATDGNGDNVKLSALKIAGTDHASASAADLLKQFADAAVKGVEGATVEGAQSGTYTLNGKEYPAQSFTLTSQGTKTYCAITGAISGDYFVYYIADSHDQSHVDRLLSGITEQ
ncbi:MAG: hypothetical protein J6D54_00275 [Olsenella sp.]|nr:hypothetical protein [Olsenella sp.]